MNSFNHSTSISILSTSTTTVVIATNQKCYQKVIMTIIIDIIYTHLAGNFYSVVFDLQSYRKDHFELSFIIYIHHHHHLHHYNHHHHYHYYRHHHYHHHHCHHHHHHHHYRYSSSSSSSF